MWFPHPPCACAYNPVPASHWKEETNMSIKDKISGFVGNAKVKAAACMATASAALAPAAAFAAEGDAGTSTVVASMNTAFSGIVSDLTTALAGIAPIALGLLGIGLAIGLGVKLFKKVTNKAV